MVTGTCQCGDIRYVADGEPFAHTLCHCRDCRAAAGAPAVAWIAYPRDAVRVVQGSSRCSIAVQEATKRYFCPRCGTGLFQINRALRPAIVEIQSCTLDAPTDGPHAHERIAEQLPWMDHLAQMAEHQRYPF